MSFHVNLDIRNPGQYYAALGLLEIANVLDPAAMGLFDTRDGVDCFVVQTKTTLAHVLQSLKTKVLPLDGEKDPFTRLRLIDLGIDLDWYLYGQVGLRSWAAGQKIYPVMTEMMGAISTIKTDENLLSTCVPCKPSPLWYDARLSRSADPRSVGFKFESKHLAKCPAIDVFAVIGLQRLSPREVWYRTYEYHVWYRHPLPVMATPDVGFLWPQSSTCKNLVFQVRSRAKYKYFMFALDQANAIDHSNNLTFL